MYINYYYSISPAGIFGNNTTDVCSVPLVQGMQQAKEPDYTNWILPMQLRRMSKSIRMSVYAVKQLIDQDDESKQFAGIFLGTGYGMLYDSEHFLSGMIDRQEITLNPTSFIQSTHNTVAGHLAMMLQCNAHNMTYTDGGHSFENAIIDAEIYLDTIGDRQQILLGAADEITPTSFNIMNELVYKKNKAFGEGVAFLSVSKTALHHNNSVKVEKIAMSVTSDKEEGKTFVDDFINSIGAFDTKSALLLIGDSEFYNALIANSNPENIIRFKDYCGEYPTASAYGMCLAVHLLRQREDIKNALVVHRSGQYWSCFFLSAIK